MLTHFSISQQGQSHILKKVPCQDYSKSCRVHVERFDCDIIIAAISDGVGSCDFSQYGSETAVDSFVQCVEHNICNVEKITGIDDENMLKVIRHAFHYALTQVEKRAEKEELPFMQFDSTLTGVIYDGKNLWFGHVGDDGIVALYTDATYEMITSRCKGEEANSVMPLRDTSKWQFGQAKKDVASFAMMTDGVLDYCVSGPGLGNRVYFPFLEPALTEVMETDEKAEHQKQEWEEYLKGSEIYKENFREHVTDDITFLIVENAELVKKLPKIEFDFDKWKKDYQEYKKKQDEALYAEYNAYKKSIQKGKNKQKSESSEHTSAEIAEEQETKYEEQEGIKEGWQYIRKGVQIISNSLLKSPKTVKKPPENQNSEETDWQPVVQEQAGKDSKKIESEKVPAIENKTAAEKETPNSSATNKKVNSAVIDVPIYESKPADED